MPQIFDVIIIGSGFGGSVAAMRLAQKGYSVAVLEAGLRYRKEDFPKTNWNLCKYLWAPALRCFGFQKITLLKGIMVLGGAGVGGGSLVYANTLMKPETRVFRDPKWPGGLDWEKELSPFYDEAKKMLGVTTNPMLAEADLALKEVARKMSVESTYHPTEVGVYFGEPDVKVSDPYFSGSGPDRSGCNFCGGCMVGCRYGAKNTLDYNYLYFAEKWGAEIFPATKASRVIPDAAAGYRIETVRTDAWFGARGPDFFGKKIVLAAGVLGTVDLLLKNRDVFKTLPRISRRLGETVRTNGESLLGVTTFDKRRDFSRGIAIGSAFHPDNITKIEAVRYPTGSDFMRLLAVPGEFRF